MQEPREKGFGIRHSFDIRNSSFSSFKKSRDYRMNPKSRTVGPVVMKVVVGLGNPGLKYRNTRHNVGFRVIRELAKRHTATKPKLKFDAEVAEVFLSTDNVLLAAPQTYMNTSGQCVKQLVGFYQLPLTGLLVVCDDLNLETGRLRLRPAGSSGGQKGLGDIINRLGTEEFARLRIGIGQPPARMDASDYVLSRFTKKEAETIEQAVMTAADGVEVWTNRGLDAAMNTVNAPATE